MKYHIVPFGCQMNRSDAERFRTVLDSMGYVETSHDDDPDIAIKGIVACSVRQKAIDRVYGKIQKWNKTKNDLPLITFVSGCILPADKIKFLKMFDLVFSIDQLPQLPDMIRQYGVPSPASLPGRENGVSVAGKNDAAFAENPSLDFAKHSNIHGKSISTLVKIGSKASSRRPDFEQESLDLQADPRQRIENFWHLKPRFESAVEAYVPIQNGCDKFCTFCAVPYTRGREISRPSQDILAEVRNLVERGFKSITLLGQNVNSYGLDKPGKELSFSRLMQEIGEIGQSSGGDFWTYFTSPHPRDITVELLEVMAAYPVLANWVHLPLQSGDDKILLRMNRNHSMDRYRSVVADIRRILPRASLFTDIIVGFIGESEAQFQASADAMREFRYDMAYIAQYSPRPGALSARWDDDVPAKEKIRRFQVLSEILQEIAAPVNQSRIGSVIKVLSTGENQEKGYFSGYTEGRIPVRIQGGNALVGEFADVKITSARPLSIEGYVVSSVGKIQKGQKTLSGIA